MHCCESPAIPKTSINGYPFFAHHVDGCTSAPETVWHVDAKELVAFNLSSMGIECEREKDGGHLGWNWIADIYFIVGGRQIAVELQHSPQTLKEYHRRQVRYEECGVECYWLVYGPRLHALIKAMAQWRIKNEFGGKFPPAGIGIFPFMRDIPVAQLDTGMGNMVRGAAGLQVTVGEFLASITEKRFQWKNGKWIVAPPRLSSTKETQNAEGRD
jgi:competence protein CoiA